jgi:3-phenylpropionate/cinnamic acid dioxygenase small subunit
VEPVSPEDRLAIEALVTEYAWILDHRQWHEVAGLCADDVELDIRRRKIIGRDGVAAWAEERSLKKRRKTQHQMTLLRLEHAEQDVVTGTAALVLHVAKSGGPGSYVDLVGEYEDEYVRTPDGWKFRRRKLVPIDEG